MVVFKANVALNASMSAYIMNDLIFMLKGNELYIPDISDWKRQQRRVLDQRGRRKTAELHTSGSKRAETLARGLKW